MSLLCTTERTVGSRYSRRRLPHDIFTPRGNALQPASPRWDHSPTPPDTRLRSPTTTRKRLGRRRSPAPGAHRQPLSPQTGDNIYTLAHQTRGESHHMRCGMLAFEDDLLRASTKLTPIGTKIIIFLSKKQQNSTPKQNSTSQFHRYEHRKITPPVRRKTPRIAGKTKP